MKYILIIMMLGFATFSCKFEPTGTNFVEVSPIFEPIDIDLNFNPSGDTIYVTNDRRINLSFNFQESNKELDFAVFYLEDEEINEEMIENARQNGYQGYSINTADYEIGSIQTLYLDMLFESGTGSLGDVVGSERLVVSKKWYIKIVNEIDLTYSTPRIVVEDQKLRLEWDEPTQNDIQQLEIFKLGSINNGARVINRYYVYDSIPNNYYDDRYIGEPARYFLKATDQLGYELFSDTVSKASELDFNYEIVGDSVIQFNWNKCNYPENFDYYSLNLENHNTNTIDNINDTTYNISVKRGYQGEVSWLSVPKNGYEIYVNNDTLIYLRKNVVTGIEFPDYYYSKAFGQERVFLMDNDNNGKIFNIETRAVELEYKFNRRSIYSSGGSMNGDHFLAFADAALFWFNTKEGFVKRLDLLALTEGGIEGNSTGSITDINISNNGIAILQNYWNNYFIDLNADKLLLVTEHTHSESELYRFDNKDKFVYKLHQDKITKYEFNNGNLIRNGFMELGFTSRSSTKFYLSPNNQFQAFIGNDFVDQTTQVIDLDLFVVNKEYPKDILNSINLNENIYWEFENYSNYYEYTFYDLLTQEKLATYELSRETRFTGYQFGYLFGRGQLLKVDL